MTLRGRSRLATSDQYAMVCLAEIAREIGRSENATRHLLNELADYGIHPRIRSNRSLPIMWESRAIDVLKALIDVPHRPVGTSWLDTYLQGETSPHEQLPRRPDAPGQA